jgi:hypothetical protein
MPRGFFGGGVFYRSGLAGEVKRAVWPRRVVAVDEHAEHAVEVTPTGPCPCYARRLGRELLFLLVCSPLVVRRLRLST